MLRVMFPSPSSLDVPMTNVADPLVYQGTEETVLVYRINGDSLTLGSTTYRRVPDDSGGEVGRARNLTSPTTREGMGATWALSGGERVEAAHWHWIFRRSFAGVFFN